MPKVKELLSDPSKWTQHVIARDSNGEIVSSFDQSATCFCLYGAVRRCYSSNSSLEAEVWSRLMNICDNRDPIGWNDDPERTHAEVLELVTRLDI